MCHISDYEHYFIGDKMNAIRSNLKTEFENLARRQSGKFIDYTATAEINTYAVYFRDRDGWIYCWMVQVDENDDITHAQELLVFDSENAPESIPGEVANDVARLDRWKAIMALDPQHDESYYAPSHP